MARALSTAREDEILKLRRQGKTHFQIASEVGLTRRRVGQILEARGDTFQPPVKGDSAAVLPGLCEYCGGRLRYTTEPITGQVVGICSGSGFRPGCGRMV